MGKRGDVYDVDATASWRCQHLPYLKDNWQGYLKELESAIEIPDDAFVFYGYGGVTYLYILTEANDYASLVSIPSPIWF